MVWSRVLRSTEPKAKAMRRRMRRRRRRRMGLWRLVVMVCVDVRGVIGRVGYGKDPV